MASTSYIPPEFLPALPISGQQGFQDITTTNIGDLSLTPTYPSWGQVQSGSILSEALFNYPINLNSGNLSWDVITTGRNSLNWIPERLICNECKRDLTSQPRVWTGEASVSSGSHHCWDCAGYDPKKGGFGWQREEWIRSTYAFAKDTPAGIIADYLEDHGRTEDAKYLRNRSSQ